MTLSTSPDTSPLASCDPGKTLDAACADVEAKISRCDNKASLLLAFDGAVLAGLAGVSDQDLALPAQLVGGAAVLALAIAAVLLLLVVRPNLGGRGRIIREGFSCWAQMSEDDLLHAMHQDTRLTRVRTLSIIALTKFQRLARAVDIILAALALLLVAAVLAVAG
ncbi:Pycsar system effector family protein [Streptomyces sp. enrichment culture]|uniref:Pycsar system effector family protein n=1 Tax=Streptomyces sp. enrichment culture TaxID=1795815 RepID=UPI003F5542A8